MPAISFRQGVMMIPLALTGSLAVVHGVIGQAPEAEDVEAQRTARMDAMRDIMGRIEIYDSRDGKQRKLKMVERPLTHHNDASRRYQDGTTWAYGDQGRPVALITCQTSDAKSGQWWNAATSLSDQTFRAERSGGRFWSPSKAGVEFKPVPNSPKPADSVRRRLIQMRQIARRFTAHQFWDPNNQRYQLRMLPQPMYRYSDPDRGQVDGTIFVFSYNINPEMVLVIEAVAGQTEPTWKYALAKLGSAEFHAHLDGAEVWKEPRAPGVRGRPNDPYYLFNSTTEIATQ